MSIIIRIEIVCGDAESATEVQEKINLDEIFAVDCVTSISSQWKATRDEDHDEA